MPLRAEPQMRKDGQCARRGCKVKLGALTVARNDPFCSQRCVKSHFGVTFKTDSEQNERRSAQAQGRSRHLTPEQRQLVRSPGRKAKYG